MRMLARALAIVLVTTALLQAGCLRRRYDLSTETPPHPDCMIDGGAPADAATDAASDAALDAVALETPDAAATPDAPATPDASTTSDASADAR